MTKGSTVVPAPAPIGKERPPFMEAKHLSWRYKAPIPTVEPLLVSERFNNISKGHSEERLPSLRKREHFNLVLRSDMHCTDRDKAESSSSLELAPPGKWTIDPRGKSWVAYFDQAIAVSLIYTAFVTPYEIGFLIGQKAKIDTLFILGNLINMVFIVDFILNFFLHFQRSSENGGVYEGNHRSIVWNYVRSYCVVDFASSVPWDIVEMMIGGDGRLKALRLLRLLRLLKLLRIVRGSRLIEKYKAEFQFSFAHVTLGLYVATIMLFAHWVACLWGYAATSRSGGNTWMVAEEIEDAHPFTQYTVALYFATMTITTVGYGDVTPQNRDEYLLVTIVMIAGGFLWAYVIGGICTLVATMNFDKRRFQQDFDRVNSMLNDLGMPASFCTYVRRYMFNAESMLRRNCYKDLTELLTPHQQREIAVHRSRANLVQIPYLRDCTPESVLKVYSALKQMVYAPQEMLDLPHTLYIVVNNGIVVKSGNVYSLGCCLSVDFILENEQLIDKSVGTALTFVQVETLHRSVLFNVLEQFPLDYAVVRRAKIRLSLMRKVVELAQIELIRRKGDTPKNTNTKPKRRWSTTAGGTRSLSTCPVVKKRVDTREATVMYALAPKSPSESGMSFDAAGDQKIETVEDIAHEVVDKPKPRRRSIVSVIGSKKRQSLPATSMPNYIPPFSQIPHKPFPGDANARAADIAAEHDALFDIKSVVTRLEDRTTNIEKVMTDITQTLAALTTLLDKKEKEDTGVAILKRPSGPSEDDEK
mmetsp:Transcript_32682/g.41975  ORF Transcript_32682/g.41975 Transcript_32682/m.41975 type:complete len:757 (+) Transcript_32682:158-2428(+)